MRKAKGRDGERKEGEEKGRKGMEKEKGRQKRENEGKGEQIPRKKCYNFPVGTRQ